MKKILTLCFCYMMATAGLHAQQWSFETGAENWLTDTGTVEPVSDVAFDGSQSMKVISSTESGQLEFKIENYKDAQPTDTLSFYVWVDDANQAKINGFQLFYKTGASWDWNAVWVNGSSLTANSWTRITTVIAEDAALVQSFGLQLNETDASSETTFYVDQVEVIPYTEPQSNEREAVTFNFDNNLDDWNVVGGTMESSGDYFLSGLKSVKLTSADDAAATDFKNSTYLDIQPGDTISFMVLAEDFTNISGFQMYSKNGKSYDWDAIWIDVGELEAYQWNKVIYEVPESVTDIREWGFQLVASSADVTPVVYLENASISLWQEKEIVITDPVYETFDFTDGELMNWTIGNNHGIADSTTFESYSGLYGVKLSKQEEDNQIEFVLYNPPAFAVNQTIRYKVFVPTDTTNITAIAPFIQFDGVSGDDNEWDGYANGWYTPNDLTPGTWNEVSVTVPEHISLKALGLQVVAGGTGSMQDIFVDYITSDTVDVTHASLSNVSELATDSLSTTYAAISWTPPVGRGLDHYQIRRHRSPGFDNETIFEAGADITSFVDTTVRSASSYSYMVIPFDTLGRRPQYVFTQTTAVIPEYTAYHVWDFEAGAEGWIDGSTDDTVTVVDSVSYSGFHSVLLGTPESEPYNYILFENLTAEAGQHFEFRFYLPEDATNISGFTVSSDVNGDTTFVYKAFNEFETGAWNTFDYQIGDNDDTSWLAFSVISSSTGASPVFVDLISSDPRENGIPTVTNPTDLEVTSIDYNDLTFEWSPATGNGEIEYYYEFIKNPSIPFQVILMYDHTSDEILEFNGLESGTNYGLQVYSVDPFGRRTSGIMVNTSTKAFDTQATFDFERDMDGWTASQGKVSRSSDRAFSGYYSVYFETGATESFFELISEDTEAPGTPTVGDIQLGHTLTYRIWVSSEDTAKIELFQVWAKDGAWGWTSNVYTVDDIVPDTWSELSYTIPADINNLNSVGFQIIGVNNENPEIGVYIDLVSTENTPVMRPHFSIPEITEAEPEGTQNVNLSWHPSLGGTPDHYSIHRAFGADSDEFEEVHVTSDTTFTDFALGTGNTFKYKVAAVQGDLQTEFSEVVTVTTGDGTSNELTEELPDAFRLYNNYPNPFNPSTQIRYDVPQSGAVTLKVYNLTGQLVQTLVNEVKTPGRYSAQFNANGLASGIYFYQMEAGSFVQVQRMTLIK